MTHNEGARLYELARFHAPVPAVVELGSWKGRSTTWLASTMKDRGERVGLTSWVAPICAKTAEAAGQWPPGREIGLLFIDSSHEYEDVRKDFELWSPMGASGGWIAFHDVPSWPGPTRVVAELPRWVQPAGTVGNLWVRRKT